VSKKAKTMQALVRAVLLNHLHGDLLPIVLGYAATIDLRLLKVLKGPELDNDATLPPLEEEITPVGLCLHKNELFVADPADCCVRVFHAPNGRMLRRLDLSKRLLNPDCVRMLRDGAVLYVGSDNIMQSVMAIDPLDGHTVFSTKNKLLLLGTSDDHVYVKGPDGRVLAEYEPDLSFKRVIRVFTQLNGKEQLGRICAEEESVYVPTDNIFQGIYKIDLMRGITSEGFKPWENSDFAAVQVFGEQVVVCDAKGGQLVIFHRSTSQVTARFSLDGVGGGAPNDSSYARRGSCLTARHAGEFPQSGASGDIPCRRPGCCVFWLLLVCFKRNTRDRQIA
jgi:hypothetical protein